MFVRHIEGAISVSKIDNIGIFFVKEFTRDGVLYPEGHAIGLNAGSYSYIFKVYPDREKAEVALDSLIKDLNKNYISE